MNEKEIKTILSELYEVDPSLRQQEEDLKKVIVKFLSAKPNVAMTAEFKQELRAELLRKAGEIKPLPKEDIRGFLWIKIFTARNFAFASVSIVIMVVIMIITLYQTKDNGTQTNLYPNRLGIEKLSSRAFGELSATDLQPSGGGGFGGGLAKESAYSTDQTTVGSSASDITAPDIMPVPYGGGTNYIYQYDGDISAPATSLEVLKRLTGNSIKFENTNLINSLGVDIVDLSSFPDSELQTITLIQNKESGYTIDVNLNLGLISAYEIQDQQYLKGDVATSCVGLDCENENLTAADIPADEILISLADDFLDKHGVDLTGYGQPEVQNQWGRRYATETSAPLYISDIMQVVYPLVVNGKTVYQVTGEKNGLYVSINIRQQRVTGFSNLAFQQYQSSSYETIQDLSQIEAYVQKGGIYGYEFPNPDNTITFSLGEPSLQYVQMSKMDGLEYVEYLVPGLIFEVSDQMPTNAEFVPQQYVVVPLIKDFFVENSMVDYGETMPLRETPPAPAE